MLEAAKTMVNRTGLTVSLEHISLEDVIRDAGVARSAVYRRWPHKDLFFSDLLKELAGAPPPVSAADSEALAVAQRVAIEHLDGLSTPQGRHDLCVELFRQTALADFAALHGSIRWRTYMALHATFLSLPEGGLRDEVRRALADAERQIIARVAGTYQRLAELLGYRLRPDTGATFEVLASLVSAMTRGQSVMSPSSPEVTDRRITGRPFGSTEAHDWSEPAIGVAAITFSLLEPDPTIEWGGERVAAVRRTIENEGLAGL
ncbi:hypothetical protein [Georgenia halophila]